VGVYILKATPDGIRSEAPVAAEPRHLSVETAGALEEAAAALRAGGLVVFPTDTLYALGADPLNGEALGRLVRAKGGRDAPIPLLLPGPEALGRVAAGVPGLAFTLARQFWPGENPIGKRLNFGAAPATGLWQTVIGVVGDVRLQSSRQEKPDPMVYFPMAGPQPRSWGVGSPAYVVKTARADAITSDVRNLVHQYAPGAPMYRIFTMEGLAARSMAQLSFTMLMIIIAAVLSIVLGAVGVYGVLSYVVAQRTRELAVRMALGAEASSVRRMVVMQGSRVTMLGVALGILAALGLTGVLESLLFGVKALDVPTFAAMSALMLVVAFLASYLPARRASSVDPIEALRGD